MGICAKDGANPDSCERKEEAGSDGRAFRLPPLKPFLQFVSRGTRGHDSSL